MSSDDGSDYEDVKPKTTKKPRSTKSKKADDIVTLEPEKPTFEGDLDDEDFTPFPFLKDVDFEQPQPKVDRKKIKKLYIPKSHSAASAVLIALHQLIYKDESKHLGTEFTKAEVVEESSNYTSVAMEASDDNQYGGYSATKTLITHGLIVKVAGGRRVMLTKAGAFTAMICIARDGLEMQTPVDITVQNVANEVVKWYKRDLPVEIDQNWVIEQKYAESPKPKKAPAKKAAAPRKKKQKAETESESESEEESN